ncbi:hypothetical protein EYF80_050016 [Liparis tanakae]|uniref:Uncharacterized protein n=1 Tax=Liparis tanakae TaxID=230148 RepID=A0A4Z2FF88_9TELE|nr:hypothetical protein EYF80_050016 [Liparis tanakae]
MKPSPHASRRGLAAAAAAAARGAEGATAAAGRGAADWEGVCGAGGLYTLSNIRWCHGHKQTGPKSILGKWSPPTKQLSGLRLQNESDPRPVSAGLNSEIESSQLIYYAPRSNPRMGSRKCRMTASVSLLTIASENVCPRWGNSPSSAPPSTSSTAASSPEPPHDTVHSCTLVDQCFFFFSVLDIVGSACKPGGKSEIRSSFNATAASEPKTQ